jgi:hypothetical protein
VVVAAVLIDVKTIPASYLFMYLFSYYDLFKEAAVGGGAVD